MKAAFIPSASCAFFTPRGSRVTSTRPIAPTAHSTFVVRNAQLFSPSKRYVRSTRMAAEQGSATTAKELAQLYGGSYLGTSIGLSIVSYIVLYFMVAAGVDVRSLINAFGDWLATTPIGRPSALDSISDTASTATLAYIAHKATSPLRFPLTVAATPVVAKAFSKKDMEKDP